MTSIRLNEPMKNHTSFKVGGATEIFFEPFCVAELKNAIVFLKRYNIPYIIIGNGSNLLVSDKGLKGAVVKIGDNFSSCEINGEDAVAGSGILLSSLAKLCARHGLTGLEFASGIPGTLGGATAMNAGAYNGEMKDVIAWVEVLDENSEIIRMTNDQMNFGYRRSIVEDKGYIVISAGLKLRRGQRENIDALMADLTQRRKSKQPLHLPSAGSTFKRPEGYFAGKLIEDSGLRGFSIGGAQVSDMHCGFIVNSGNATAKDIYDLIKYVQNTVYYKFNVKLEPEVKILGEF